MDFMICFSRFGGFESRRSGGAVQMRGETIVVRAARVNAAFLVCLWAIGLHGHRVDMRMSQSTSMFVLMNAYPRPAAPLRLLALGLALLAGAHEVVALWRARHFARR
jgi:hypothetical protein